MEGKRFVAAYTGRGEQLDEKSLHLAIQTEDGWQELNFGIGVLFVKADFEKGVVPGITKLMEQPVLFRRPDKRIGVAAVTTTAEGQQDAGLFLWVTDDLVHFQEEGRVENLSVSGQRQNISVRAKQVELKQADAMQVEVKQVNANQVHAKQVEASILEITEAEADYLLRKLGEVYNTSVDSVTVHVPIGEKLTTEQMPGLTAYYSDGSKEEIRVIWNQEDLAKISFDCAGTYTVEGEAVVKDYPAPMISAIADPMIRLYNGRYYLIATDETVGNRNLYVRSADKIEDLSKAEPKLIFSGPDSGDYSRCNWAPELHVIGEHLYCLFASSTTGKWDGVQSRVMKCIGNPEVKEDWEQPVRVTKKDGTPLIEQGITLDMTYFEAAGKHYYCWANRVIDERGTDTSDLYLAEMNPAHPERLDGDPVCLLRPQYAWDRQHTEVDEGPHILKHDGKLFLSFSGDSVSDYYCLSWLTAEEAGNLLEPSSWVETGYPVLGREHVEGERGPGHNAFTQDEYGRDVLIYHMKPNGGTRSFCARTIHYGFDGTPLLYLTADRFLKPEFRKVKGTVIVGAGAGTNENKFSENKFGEKLVF